MIIYHSNGEIKQQTNYSLGIKNGICAVYDKYGNPSELELVRNNLIHGELKQYEYYQGLSSSTNKMLLYKRLS